MGPLGQGDSLIGCLVRGLDFICQSLLHVLEKSVKIHSGRICQLRRWSGLLRGPGNLRYRSDWLRYFLFGCSLRASCRAAARFFFFDPNPLVIPIGADVNFCFRVDLLREGEAPGLAAQEVGLLLVSEKPRLCHFRNHSA